MNNGIVRRGFGLAVGVSTPQNMSLAINGDWNNTIIWGTNGSCQSITTAQCTFSRGGAFNSSASTSFSSPQDPGAQESRAADNGRLGINALGTDTVFLNSTVNLTDFPLFTPGVGDLPQSGLGLGRNSTFLDHLFSTKQIASRTWSLFWGLEGAEAADKMDGSLVLGGYDAAKTTGANFTGDFSVDNQCPSSLIVVFEDVTVNFPNGTQASLIGSSPGAALRSCIKPDIPLITFPSNEWEAFSAAIGGNFAAPSYSYKLWGMDYLSHGLPEFNMTFTLASGLSLTVPNSQLVVPDVRISNSGSMEITNSSVREVLIYNLEQSNVNDMPLLGQAFLSSVYLHVNNDGETFTIWQSQPTLEEKLITVGNSQTATNCAASIGNASSPAQPSSPTHKLLSGAGIAGVVLGVLVAISCITFCAWKLRGWKASKQRQSLPHDSKSPIYDTFKEIVYEVTSGEEMVVPAQEMHGETSLRQPPQEMACPEVEWVYEVSGDRTSRSFGGDDNGAAPEPPPKEVTNFMWSL